MKANKKYLTDQIEIILAEDIADMAEIDVTSEKLIKLIWPYFEYYETQENIDLKKQNTELSELLKKSVKIIKQMDKTDKKIVC